MFKSIVGMVTVELTSADIPGTLAALADKGVPVFDAEPVDDLSLRLRIYWKDYRKTVKLCEKRGDTLRIQSRSGIYWAAKAIAGRPLLMAGLAVLLAAAFYIPSRVFFIRVEGNVTVPVNVILEAAEESGIGFGASRREVRSERMKNALLGKLPELQWAGVNTYGCVAVITVRERHSASENVEEFPDVSSIVASTDGYILSATATRGSLLCQPGQAVVEGQVLISGYTDCGICIQATRAEGEVYAQTRHDLTVYTPSECTARGETAENTVRWSLLIGKKRINLWKDSGISDSSCGRMYKEYYITLPGGFVLPVALVKETIVTYKTETAVLSPEDVQRAMEDFAGDYLVDQMIAGTVDAQQFIFLEEGDCLRLEGAFLCTEMIGRQRVEEIGDIHG